MTEPGGSEETAPHKVTRLPWRYWRPVRLVEAAFLIIFGLAITIYILFAVSQRYTFTKASFISQSTVGSSSGSHELEVGVIFIAGNHTIIKTYVYPNSKHLTPGAPVPVYYLNSDPKKAYYASPSDRLDIIVIYVYGGVSLLAGLALLASVIRRRRRIIALASRPGPGHAVYLDWEKNLRMATVHQEGGPKYTWQVLPPDPPIGMILRFVRCLRNNAQVRDWPRWKLNQTFGLAMRCAEANAPAWPATNPAEVLGDLGPHKWIVIRAGGELVVPTSRAEPVIGTGQAGQPQLAVKRRLLLAHRRLLAAYITVLDQARLLPRFGSLPTEDERRSGRNRLLCWRPLVILHIESHMRRELRLLANAYVRAQMLIPKTSEDADKKRRDLARLREDCQLLTSSLTDRPRRVASFLIALAAVLPLIPAIAKTPQLPFDVFLRIVRGILIAFLVLAGASSC